MRDFRGKRSTTWSRDLQVAAAGPAPGKRTLTEMLPPTSAPVQRKAAASIPAPVMPNGPLPTIYELFGRVQRKASGAELDTAAIHESAQQGIATAASPLPHAETIQRAFGRHDISGIKAHTGADATASAAAIGATAYATGDHVVLGDGADLHTVAHEAAHVVQQRGGVQLKGGIGETEDVYERQADQVADRVVQGESAEHLLDLHSGPRGSDTPIQRKRYAVTARKGFKNSQSPEDHGKFLAQATDEEIRTQWLPESLLYDTEDWATCCRALDDKAMHARTEKDSALAQRLLAHVPPTFRERFVADEKTTITSVLNQHDQWANDPVFAKAREMVLGANIDETIWREAVVASRLFLGPVTPRAIGQHAMYTARIFHLLESILRSGVLPPAELVKRGIIHGGSSDGGQPSEESSFFDIDHTRANKATRFGKPGLSALSVMLERPNNMYEKTRQLLERALTDEAASKALLDFARSQGEAVETETLPALITKLLDILKRYVAFRDKPSFRDFSKNENKDNNDNEKNEVDPMLVQDHEMKYVPWFLAIAEPARFGQDGVKELSERGRTFATVVSTGPQRESSKLAQVGARKDQPSVTEELRTGVPMQPGEITHVILPIYMRGFRPVYKWPVELRFAGFMREAKVNYYDHTSRADREVTLNHVLDHQSEIDELGVEGHQKMITHTTHY